MLSRFAANRVSRSLYTYACLATAPPVIHQRAAVATALAAVIPRAVLILPVNRYHTIPAVSQVAAAAAAAAAATSTMASPLSLESKAMFSSSASAKPEIPYIHTLHTERMNRNVLAAEYAVRGSLVVLAGELEQRLKEGDKSLPFDSVVFCNIGNPQQLGQPPVTFYREVMALLTHTSLLEGSRRKEIEALFSQAAIQRAEEYLQHLPHGMGAYSNSQGTTFVRENVAKFITERDGGIPSNANDIFLTNGASEAISAVLGMLIRDNHDGIMIPLPQYPLYSASLSLYNGHPIPYVLDESKEWEARIQDLEKCVAKAKSMGKTTRGITVINPGNPTGQVLSVQSMQEIIKFCHKHRIVLLADEVYQENIYSDKRQFHSFKKVLREMGQTYADVELFSFHSTSKGFLGECGYRGGYMEATGMHKGAAEELLKLRSIGLCSNVPGQVMVSLMVHPPAKDSDAYELFHKETQGVIDSMKKRANMIVDGLNKMENISCNPTDGAMYVFPSIHMPAKAVLAANGLGVHPDYLYVHELLVHTGVCVVPGSGFGQKDGTFHFRTTILPPTDQIDAVLSRMAKFNQMFMDKYRD